MSESHSAVLAGQTVRLLGPKRIGEPTAAGLEPMPPRVEIVQEGGQIRGLEIFCRCGEVIRVSFGTNAHD